MGWGWVGAEWAVKRRRETVEQVVYSPGKERAQKRRERKRRRRWPPGRYLLHYSLK